MCAVPPFRRYEGRVHVYTYPAEEKLAGDTLRFCAVCCARCRCAVMCCAVLCCCRYEGRVRAAEERLAGRYDEDDEPADEEEAAAREVRGRWQAGGLGGDDIEGGR